MTLRLGRCFFSYFEYKLSHAEKVLITLNCKILIFSFDIIFYVKFKPILDIYNTCPKI